MKLTKLNASLRELLRRGQDRLPEGLLQPEQMRRLLARERVRTDRTGDIFSLITFTLLSEKDSAASLLALAETLRLRLRLTDDVGFLTPRQLAVVLPVTSGEGAWKVVADIDERFSPIDSRPAYQVYSYPGDLDPGSDGDGPGTHGPRQRHDSERRGNGAKDVCVPVVAASRRPVPVHGQHVQPMAELLVEPMSPGKRVLDVAVSLVSLILLVPLFLVIGFLIKVFSPGPVLFSQWRSGLGGKPFVMYKFRTMVADAEERKAELLALNEQDGPAFKLKNDPRTTWLGRFLRQTSLDELPQLWNVLLGDMSLVGPRPLPCREMAACSSWQQQRLKVTPGLTCIWQVRGRGTTSFGEWMRMDMQYIRSRSLIKDVVLLFLTVPAVLLRRGAH